MSRALIYNQDLYNGGTLLEYGRKYLSLLPQEVTCLVSGGASGCAIASAMMVCAAIKGRELVHSSFYSKDHVSHHTGSTKTHSGACPSIAGQVAIVDDLIDAGNTVRSLSTRIDEGIINCIIVDHGCGDSMEISGRDIPVYRVVDIDWEKVEAKEMKQGGG